MSRVRRLKLVLWILAGLATAVACSRFMFGLGSTTNLTDATPWGLWIGFDVMSGVALAAGGFIVTATVYVFRLEKFHAVVRPAVLTAFLGYAAVVVGLLFDLGLPWNIWHMIVFWNPHSALFEVGWCVMLYLTVLALEFFPVPAEEFGALARIRAFLLRFRFPLVLAGIGLSTLHQSSLGSLYLIMPYRLHPLWYTPLLPLMFLVSAIGLGLMMVIFESHFTAYLYRRQPETAVLERLAAAGRWVLILYLALRFGDLAARGRLPELIFGGWQAALFWVELGMMAVAPALIFSWPRLRASRPGQFMAAGLGITGVVLNRIDVGGLAHMTRGAVYVPSWTEVALTAGIVAGAALAFLFFVEHFKVWEERPADPGADPVRLPELDRVGATWLGAPHVAARTVYSLAFIVATALGFALLTPHPAAGRGVERETAQRARGGDILRIDGNLNGFGTSFPHQKHIEMWGGKASCPRCHHLNLPRDQASGCYQCHRQMYTISDAFGHDWHAAPDGGKLSCGECHPRGQARAAATAKPCAKCHRDLVPASAIYKVASYDARGYVDAMHQLCVGCHRQEAPKRGKPDMARCAWCHKDVRGFVDIAGKPGAEWSAGRVILPAVR
ncbi:MAG TPA: Ni/Fe-hydrogenase cytochrome b subunit [Bryobacteraceae bacterium]|nr:Ni/Fe-hydrogenase cytochrome b subunit [Bryobacteraceae bacterium]